MPTSDLSVLWATRLGRRSVRGITHAMCQCQGGQWPLAGQAAPARAGPSPGLKGALSKHHDANLKFGAIVIPASSKKVVAVWLRFLFLR